VDGAKSFILNNLKANNLHQRVDPPLSDAPRRLIGFPAGALEGTEIKV
jgi:hypothetical protein